MLKLFHYLNHRSHAVRPSHPSNGSRLLAAAAFLTAAAAVSAVTAVASYAYFNSHTAPRLNHVSICGVSTDGEAVIISPATRPLSALHSSGRATPSDYDINTGLHATPSDYFGSEDLIASPDDYSDDPYLAATPTDYDASAYDRATPSDYLDDDDLLQYFEL